MLIGLGLLGAASAVCFGLYQRARHRQRLSDLYVGVSSVLAGYRIVSVSARTLHLCDFLQGRELRADLAPLWQQLRAVGPDPGRRRLAVEQWLLQRRQAWAGTTTDADQGCALLLARLTPKDDSVPDLHPTATPRSWEAADTAPGSQSTAARLTSADTLNAGGAPSPLRAASAYQAWPRRHGASDQRSSLARSNAD